MCAIIDVNIAHEIFGDNRPEAGASFFKQIDSGELRVAIGGKLREELYKQSYAQRWFKDAIRSNIIRNVDDKAVNNLAKKLERQRVCESDDQHIIALAKQSGARLLYSNDIDLRKDFTNKALIDQPRGKIYSTLRNSRFTDTHRKLLNNRNLCRTT